MSTRDDHIVELRDSELVFGFVSPLGTTLTPIVETLEQRLHEHGYDMAEPVRISKLLAELQRLEEVARPEVRQETLMDAGNRLRARYGGEVLALMAIAGIEGWRRRTRNGEAAQRTAHVIRSLKHPKEVEELRAVYGKGFFLVGVSAPLASRNEELRERDFPKYEAQRLLGKDRGEEEKLGQQTRATFHLSDAFVRISHEEKPPANEQIKRLVDLALSHPFLPPTADEHAMFMAYAAAMRSTDLSRQVGAVIVNERGDIIASGANDVPAAGGGSYWPDPDALWPDLKPDGGPDYVRGFDSNEAERDAILGRVIRALVPEEAQSIGPELIARYRERLKDTGLLDLTEFGRAVHAEMSALLTCARSGVSPAGGTLYCTTFPCHNCTKHIVEAGIRRVVYVEPYPKSKARTLHDDSIVLPDEMNAPVNEDDPRVRYQAFTGVGPRRFVDLFSLSLGSGRPIDRKQRDRGGQRRDWKLGDDSIPRLPLDPRSYLDREKAAAQLFAKMDLDRGKVAEPSIDLPGDDA